MLSIYLSSLDNLLIRRNPVRLMLRQIRKNTLSLFNLRKNMQAAEKKRQALEQRRQFVRHCIAQDPGHRIDLKR